MRFYDAGVVAGTGGADVVVHFTSRSRKVGILPFLSSVAWIVGLVLLVSSPGELLESVRFRHYFDDDEEPAWFYLVFAGIFGGLAGRDPANSGTAVFRRRNRHVNRDGTR